MSLSAPPAVRPPSPPADGVPAARTFLFRYVRTLLPLIVALVVLAVGWEVLADGVVDAGRRWGTAAVAVTAWTVVAAAWLVRRGWRGSAVRVVAWAGPAVVGLTAAPGWLSPDGLVLWAPMTSVLAVASIISCRSGSRRGAEW